jgi:hypothetical protein
MKTQIKNTVKAAFLMLLTISIFSCSKKDDEPVPTPATESYTVPVEITFNGITHTSSIDVLVPDISINPCNTIWAIAEQKVEKFGFVIGNFNASGGTIDKIVDPNGCAKMKFEGKRTDANLGDLEYFIKTDGGGTIVLVGKTYTMTCTAYRLNDSAESQFPIKAVWTKP